ncbi:nitric oxide reductase transcriptional regulator NorR [Kineobactrum salinum]|uniref:Nitric oxide reductase transcriptional regulator NorR n=1 Tax=Kineobactrum salinum TaxID=2708301 RepID=A0A6C0U5X7_9GAMM|nr:nitric oxide reductase transcriptional regulator NorR [Kineobactrum salinum]QIB65825.1 nitric oxide reductase transcriptional regulator NorR [Kineobactrum salinum]
MTTHQFFDTALAVVADLSRDLLAEQRYARLLQGLKQVFPCDAAALLQLRASTLYPLAVDGLSDDTLGRQFLIETESRFARILLSREPVRFAADCELPDPYDGLIDSQDLAGLHVHDCLGMALYLDDVPWGILTLDALQPDAFDRIDPAELRAFIRLTEATIRIAQTIQRLQARAEREHLLAQAVVAEQAQPELIGNSKAIKALRQDMAVVAHSDLATLITGETGVGKELVARHLHARSARADRPLVYVNCAALPENLVESELFGHARGAFTGASQARTGKFELADGGSLFLDEIGEMPLAMQPKLLRALQSGEVQRVGSDSHHRVDVRIITATNRDLGREVATGHFRADLYHRISVYPIAVPALRERGRDVLLLAGHFLELNRRRFGLRGLRLDSETREALLAYDWPGNVRELEHLISRAVLRLRAAGDGRGLLTVGMDVMDLPRASAAPAPAVESTPGTLPAAPQEQSLRAATEMFQRELVQHSLRQHNGNQASTARALGLDRGNLNRLLKRLQIR